MASHLKLPTRAITIDKSISDKKTNINYFRTVKLGEAAIRVILYMCEGDPLGHVLLRRCNDADYNCQLLHEENQVIQSLKDTPQGGQVVVLVDSRTTTSLPGSSTEYNNLQHFSKFIHEAGLELRVTMMGLVKDLDSQGAMDRLLEAGVTRVLTEEDCRGSRVMWELKMVQKSEVALHERQIFSLALFEAVDQSNDAIQITGKDSSILYVNRAFLELSGYSIEEVIGQPALDIMKPFDAKQDNGPKAAVKKGQSWDGVCMGRRKSGSILRQHLKLIPVRDSSDCVYHHVTIQRLLSVQDMDNPRVCSPRSTRANDSQFSQLKKQPSLSKVIPRLESPLIKAVQMLNTARDYNSTPQDVREILDKAIESLSTSELYRIPTSGRSGGIVSGLLQSGPRLSQPFEVSFMKMAPHSNFPQNPPVLPPPPEVQVSLKNLDEWEFDILDCELVSKSRPLYYVGMKIFSQFDVCSVLNVEVGVLASWLKLMESHYHSQNPYHNSTHAADVLQATAYFVKKLQDTLVQQGDVLDHSEVASLLISAAVHDLDHPARTNPYLCNTRHELAILYNDSAVLENHHVAMCFKLTEQSKDVNIFQNLDLAAYRTLRTAIIDLVLATDMAKHFEHLTKFNVLISVDGETGSNVSLTDIVSKEHNRKNRMIMKKVLVKCADISNPCRPLHLCKVWAQRIAEEYFAQTEEEKRRNLPVVFPDFDKNTCRLPVTQVKFIDYFISGLFDAWNTFCPIPTLMDYLKSNYEYWKSHCPDSPNYSEEENDINSS